MKRTCVFIGAVVALSATAQGQVELRGGESVQAPVVRVSIEGVEVGGDTPGVISWDRVRQVVGEHAEEATPFMELAEQAWRARTRLARGDVAMAQPIFEELFTRMKGEDGLTALIVAEGLLQCRLANLAQASAVEPWLETLRLQSQTSTGQDASLLIDGATGLAPGLPPIWLAGPAVETLASQLVSLVYEDSNAGRYRALYEIAAKQAAGQPVEPIAPSDEPGLELITSMIASLSDDPDERAEAQAQLRRGLTSAQGTWKEAWRRAALGRSLLLEESPALRRQGMIHLLHVPARFQAQQPYLAGVALAIVADELRQEGDADGSRVLVEELTRMVPAHPALSWWDRQPIRRESVSLTPSSTPKNTYENNHKPVATLALNLTDKETP